MPLTTLSNAAKQIGISRTQILRLRDRGALADFMATGARGEQLVELEGLREHCAACTQQRANSFHQKNVPPSLPVADLQRIDSLRHAGGVLAERAAAAMVAAGCRPGEAAVIAQELVSDSWVEAFEFFADAMNSDD